MAYTTIPAWVSNDIADETEFDSYIRDNLIFLNSPPMARIINPYGAPTLVILDSTETVVEFTAEAFDTDTMATSFPTRLTVNTAGIYHVSAEIYWSGDNNGYRYIKLRVNGSITIAMELNDAPASVFHQHVSTDYEFAVNDYVELLVYQTSGTGFSLAGGDGDTNLAAVFVGGTV